MELEIKDRVATGDNKYIMTELPDGRVELEPAPDSVQEEGTPLNKELLQPIVDAVPTIFELDINYNNAELSFKDGQDATQLFSLLKENRPVVVKYYTILGGEVVLTPTASLSESIYIFEVHSGLYFYQYMFSLSGFELIQECDLTTLFFPGFQRLLTADDDLNNILEDGVYVYSTSSVPKNAPFANAAVITVFGSPDNTTQKIQTAYRYGVSGQSAFRPLYAGAFLEWSKTVDSVVEEGTAGSWNFRKWQSGRMEAWGNLNASVTGTNNNPAVTGISIITAQVKFPTGMKTGEENIEYCSLQARDYRIFGNMSGISSNNLWGNFTTYQSVANEYPQGNDSFKVHAHLIGQWQ